MAREKGYRGLTPAEQRAARDQRLIAQVDHVEQTKQREMKMVANLGQFTEECRWFMANKIWLVLGYETLVGWWVDRIAPLVDGMGLTPGPELAQMAIEAIQEEESALPAAQRHTKKALSAMVGASEWKVRGRRETRQDRSERRTAAVRDLEDHDVIDAEFVDTTKANDVVDPIAVFDAKYSGDVDSSPVDVSGQDPSGDTHEPSSEVELPADSGTESLRDDVALVAGQPGTLSSLARDEPGPVIPATQPSTGPVGEEPEPPPAAAGETFDSSAAQNLTEGSAPYPSTGPVLSPAAVPGVAVAGDERGEVEEESEAGQQDSSSADPASAWMNIWRTFIADLRAADADVLRPMLANRERAEMDAGYPEIGRKLTQFGVWKNAEGS